MPDTGCRGVTPITQPQHEAKRTTVRPAQIRAIAGRRRGAQSRSSVRSVYTAEQLSRPAIPISGSCLDDTNLERPADGD